jgi:hypothetical protein
MKKRTLIALLGIWVAIIPSLGLPSTWKHWVIVISGLAITVVALKKRYIIVEEPVVPEDQAPLPYKETDNKQHE